ncbi:hypothetical protein GCM10007879_14590 [Maritalea porphyrae]|uniref:Uncharacterized protein n=1 Tax=Maritalea porphyrae TaxID=880732 RepID=A0ABQ5USA9_9HYPH|nr:hypothetical protein GCM10007879_14590 [Maritalea porphyrae]
MLCASSAHIDNVTSLSILAVNKSQDESLSIFGLAEGVLKFLADQTVSLTNNLGLNLSFSKPADTLQTVAKSTACTASVRLSHNVENTTSKPSCMQVMPLLA